MPLTRRKPNMNKMLFVSFRRWKRAEKHAVGGAGRGGGGGDTLHKVTQLVSESDKTNKQQQQQQQQQPKTKKKPWKMCYAARRAFRPVLPNAKHRSSLLPSPPGGMWDCTGGGWWWLFPRFGECSVIHSPHALFYVEISSRTLSPLFYAGLSPQWLSELRRLWPNSP